jgi:hypothetical protein
MFKDLSKEEEKAFVKWAQDNYHQKVGIHGTIRAIWHPVVRNEMKRLKAEQLRGIKKKLVSMRRKQDSVL